MKIALSLKSSTEQSANTSDIYPRKRDQNKYKLCVRTIALKENRPPIRVRFWFMVSVRVRVGGNFRRGQLS